jgi:hypothetical protein
VFDADHLKGAPYADPMLGSPDFDPKFNQIDKKINRKSHEGTYKVSIVCFLNTRNASNQILSIFFSTCTMKD